MAEQTIDRMTVAWSNQDELRVARELRRLAVSKYGLRGVNRLVKDILRRWVEAQKP